MKQPRKKKKSQKKAIRAFERTMLAIQVNSQRMALAMSLAHSNKCKACKHTFEKAGPKFYSGGTVEAKARTAEEIMTPRSFVVNVDAKPNVDTSRIEELVRKAMKQGE